MRLEILGDRSEPFHHRRRERLPDLREGAGASGTRSAADHGDRPSDGFDLARPGGQAVIGAYAGRSRHALDHIEAIHRRCLVWTPSRGKITRIPEAARAAPKEVGIKRENDIGPVEPVLAV